MCKQCGNSLHIEERHDEEVNQGRRHLVITGSALGAYAAAGGSLLGASSAASAAPESTAPVRVKAYGVNKAKGSFSQMTIPRRQPGPDDIMMDILYAGVCHSDIHTVDGDWGKPALPLVPGHEIVGRVTAVGKNVTRFKVGDVGGVGCMVDSCGECENCLNDREQNCLNGTTFTYGSPDKISGGYTYGGYSHKLTVKEHFVVNIPDGMDLSRVAPIMCAGITTFSPMQHWQLKEGQKVGVIGIGGLGHMAVKLGVARGADVVAFTTSPGKVADIKAMGVKDVVLWDDKEAMKRHMASLDLMIATVPEPFNISQFMPLLKLDATLVNVGQLGTIDGLSGMMMAFGRQSVAGSMIGGMKETQEVVNFCAEHNILPDVEMIRPDQIDQAYERVKGKDIKFRFVIDMQNA